MGAHLATIGYPNDEGIPEHPLYEAGLGSLIWMGEVVGAEMGRGRRRFVIPTKENLADIVAIDFRVHRLDAAPLDAAHAVMSHLS